MFINTSNSHQIAHSVSKLLMREYQGQQMKLIMWWLPHSATVHEDSDPDSLDPTLSAFPEV